MEKPNLSEEYLPAEHTPPIPFSKVTPGGDYRLGKVDVPNMYCVEGHQNNVKSVLTYYKFGVLCAVPQKTAYPVGGKEYLFFLYLLLSL